MEKYVRTGRATVDSTVRRIRFPSWMNKVTNTHSEYILIAFPGNNGFTNAHPWYIYTYIKCLLVIHGKITVRAFQVKNLSLVNFPFTHYVISTSSRTHCYFA